MPVPKPTTNKVKESLDKGSNTAKITKVPNGILEPPAMKVSNTDPVVPVTGKMLAVLDPSLFLLLFCNEIQLQCKNDVTWEASSML